jgi:hypothetical protein
MSRKYIGAREVHSINPKKRWDYWWKNSKPTEVVVLPKKAVAATRPRPVPVPIPVPTPPTREATLEIERAREANELRTKASRQYMDMILDEATKGKDINGNQSSTHHDSVMRYAERVLNPSSAAITPMWSEIEAFPERAPLPRNYNQVLDHIHAESRKEPPTRAGTMPVMQVLEMSCTYVICKALIDTETRCCGVVETPCIIHRVLYGDETKWAHLYPPVGGFKRYCKEHQEQLDRVIL